MAIHETLAEIQHKMRVPKDKDNSFGGYKYRNAEGILAAFKGLGIEGAALTLSDTVSEVAGQVFVTATARLDIGGESVTAQGHAMHPLQKKGMDASQITGSASSYARKYALCGLFAVEDESQDPDSRDNTKEHGQTPPPVRKVSQDDANHLADLAKRAGSDRAAIFNALRVDGETWADLPADLFTKVRDGMTAKIAEAEKQKEHDHA